MCRMWRERDVNCPFVRKLTLIFICSTRIAISLEPLDILRLIEIWALGQAVEKAKLGDGHGVQSKVYLEDLKIDKKT